MASYALVVLRATAFGFAAPQFLPAGMMPNTLKSGDINNDGRLDLVAVNHRSNTISVFLADGNRGLISAGRLAPARERGALPPSS
jgi:hypothetical protein